MAARPSDIGPVGLHVGQAVARLRADRGWEQRELADRLGAEGRPVSQPVLSRIEAGARRVDVDDLVVLAAALGVAVAALLPPTADQASLSPPTARPAAADADAGSEVTGPVGSALADDIDQLGDLVGMEPTLAATAVRLARQIDGHRPVQCDDCGSLVDVPADPRILPQLTRELRATVAALVEGRTVDDSDDDLDGLGTV